MAFFDRFKKSADKKGVRPAQPTGWENMEPSQEVDADAERQKRKILGAYALGINALSEHDVKKLVHKMQKSAKTHIFLQTFFIKGGPKFSSNACIRNRHPLKIQKKS